MQIPAHSRAIEALEVPNGDSLFEALSTERQMKWIYFSLGVAAGLFAVFLVVDGVPKDHIDGLRICVTASIVNLGIFAAMHWSQKRQKSRSTP